MTDAERITALRYIVRDLITRSYDPMEEHLRQYFLHCAEHIIAKLPRGLQNP